MENNSEKKKTFWPHMIVGFLLLGITLGYWTVKTATKMPVQESNEYLMKYQQADISINDILDKKERFDKNYTIVIKNVKTKIIPIENAKRTKEEKTLILNKGKNSFVYAIKNLKGEPVSDANVSFLLTRPHTIKEDQYRDHVERRSGVYSVEDINITSPGRYITRLKVMIDKDTVGYHEMPAYLSP